MRSKLLAVAAALALAAGLTVADAAPANAAESFNPGNIIADSLFYDSSAMTQPQIQAFLDRKIGSCANGKCLNVLRASVSSRAARYSTATGNLICRQIAGGTLRISEIIYRAQVACGISAKVILVTLQKEQGLVTSRAPSDRALDAAMGQACPDTAPCDPAFQGVGVQIITGAAQLKTYKASKFARQPGTHAIRYHPTTSCGSKTVTIVNYATAALYNYTPYQPNAAALANMNGTGNSCSSYGNRNFWRDYTAWFGSTQQGSVSTIDSVAHILALDSLGELWAYPANGKGSWRPRVSLGAPWNDVARVVAPGDLDGDGHRDLITVSSGGVASLHRGDGILGYLPATQLNVDWSGAGLVTDAGDFSGDGIPDVFTTSATGRLQLWRGTGSGGLRPPIVVGSGWGAMTLIAGAGDFSGDGHPDLIARRSNGALLLYTGNGRSGWKGVAQIGSGWNGMKGIHVPGDFTGDGRRDVLASNAGGTMWVYPGSGTAKLRSPTKVGNGWGGPSAVVGPGPSASGVRVFPAGAGDVDGDMSPDVMSLTKAGELVLYRGSGNGGWIDSRVVASGWNATRTVSMGDFSGDGIPDMGGISAAGSFLLMRGDGNGGFGPPVAIGNGWGATNLLIGGVDFDGDRRIDLLARDTSGNLRLYRGNGSGGWAADGTVIGTGWGGMTAVFGAGDFNGDRRVDLIARHSDGRLLLYPTDGQGGWGSARQIGTKWNGMTALFSPGNFDRAGGTDVIGRTTAGKLILYRGDGKGGWLGTRQIGSGWNGMSWIG